MEDGNSSSGAGGSFAKRTGNGAGEKDFGDGLSRGRRTGRGARGVGGVGGTESQDHGSFRLGPVGSLVEAVALTGFEPVYGP